MPLIGGSALFKLTAKPHNPGESVSMLPTNGSATITADLTGSMLDTVTAALDERMKPLLASLEKFNKLADTYASVGENINAMLQPQDSTALANGEAPNLRTAVAKLNAAIDQATDGLRLAKEWLGDGQLRADARSAVSKANHLIEQATEAVDRYTKLAESLDNKTTDLAQRLGRVSDQIATTLEDVRSLARKANSGEGTIGMLLNNPDLYNSLNDAAIRLERTLVEVQLFVQKVKAEGLQMKLF
jgi:phospholipid/cholesterol/gamma-HCH transport system substrate-binding protein